jgi:hypothetical protein
LPIPAALLFRPPPVITQNIVNQVTISPDLRVDEIPIENNPEGVSFIRTETRESGLIIDHYTEGRKIYRHPNGNTVEHLPNNVRIHTYADGRKQISRS